MAEPSAIEKIQGKTKDERVAIAQGAAVFVVVVLFVAWGIYFFQKIQSGTQQINLESSTGQNDFNFTNVKEAQDQLKIIYGDITEDLKQLREQSQQAGGGTKQEMVQQQISSEQEESQFTDTQATVQ